MLTGLTGISFVPSNKVIMRFRHSYSEESYCLFMDHFILESQGRNSELQIRISPTWSTGNFISLLTQGANFECRIRIAFLEICLRLIILSKIDSRGTDVCNRITQRLVKHEYF